MVTPHSTSSHMDISPYTGQVPYVEKPSDLSKHLRKNSDLFTPMEKPKDFSKYEMFKPYAETPKPHTSDFPKHRSKEHYRPNDMNVHSEKPVELTSSRHKSHKDIPSSSSSKHDRVNDVRNESSSKHRLMMDLPKMLDDSGVIVKNTHQPKEDLRKLPKEDRKDNNAVITKVSHCQDVRSPEFFPQTPNMHLDYHSSTPAKSDGDDIQMFPGFGNRLQ
ncbi:hypothetical protein JTB14_006031 [Gonioctena quinquepunctata]|nr:hypothetical protein JTB14_006031 [Gonioctena quinquepunctata]